jgi:small-conductance mechanosensitive channel
MNKRWTWPNDEVALQIARPLAAFVLTLLLLLFVRHLVIKWLYSRTRGEGSFGRIALDTLRFPSLLWSIAAGVQIALEISIIPDKYVGRASTAIAAFLIVSTSMVLSSASVRALTIHGRRRGVALALSGLARTLIRVLILTCGALAVLWLYSVNITPLLTALGVGGLAVALALQDTLSNLFAGFYVSVAGQVRLGDYIKLNTGEEGYVTDISWRSTTIRALANNMIIIPNAKLAQAVVTNYCLPERRMSLVIPISVSYDSDPDQIERVLLEEVEGAAGTIAGLLAEPAPLVRFIPGFGDSALNFSLICQVAEFVDQFLVQHELRKRIWKRFRAERIEMPYPTRTVYLREGEA